MQQGNLIATFNIKNTKTGKIIEVSHFEEKIKEDNIDYFVLNFNGEGMSFLTNTNLDQFTDRKTGEIYTRI